MDRIKQKIADELERKEEKKRMKKKVKKEKNEMKKEAKRQRQEGTRYDIVHSFIRFCAADICSYLAWFVFVAQHEARAH